MRLHQSLFLNIISLAGYIDLFAYINVLFCQKIYNLFNIFIPSHIVFDSFACNNFAIPIYLFLFLTEYLLVKSKKIKPIVKIDNKIYIVNFYIMFVISILSAMFYFYAVYQLSR